MKIKIKGEIEDLKILKSLKKRKNNHTTTSSTTTTKRNGRKNSKDISGPFSRVVGTVGSLPRRFPPFTFFCLLVSSVSDFCPDTRTGGGGGHFVFFLGSLVQSRCGEGGMLQTNNTGVCLQCLTGPAPARSAHCSGSTLLCQEPSEAGPRMHALPQSKLLRLGAQVALRGADSVGPPRSK